MNVYIHCNFYGTKQDQGHKIWQSEKQKKRKNKVEEGRQDDHKVDI